MVEQYSFGYWVMRRRKALDLTRETLARRVGCATETIKKIERDERRPSQQIAELLADVLVVPLAERKYFLQSARGERSIDHLPVVTQPLHSDPVRLHNLPIHPTTLIGREKDLTLLAQLLSNPECRLLTLVGPGGIGKTRLALSMAEHRVHAFRNGVWFVALAPLQSAEHIVPAIASEIGFNFSDAGNPETELLRYLQSKELLLVLDSFEHLVDGATLLTQILRTASSVRILVTSRERLNLQDEFLFRLEGLSYPVDRDAIIPNQFSAMQLFVERAYRLRPQLAFSEEDLSAIARICRLVEGVPLAIELAATWTRLLSCRRIADEIEQSIDFLTASTRDLPVRHGSMRAVFDHSWGLLSTEEQLVLRQLSVFRGGFTHESAEEVSDASLTILSTLADKSLLQLDSASDAVPRFDLHELVRQYAQERLLGSGETDVLQARHLDYFLHVAEEAEPKLQGPEQIDWLNRLKADHDNLRTALAWALCSNAEAGLRLVGALWWFWRVCGYVNEGCEWMSKILGLPDVSPRTQLRAKGLHGAAFLESIRYNNLKACMLYEESLSICSDLGDKLGIAKALNGLGFIARRQHDWQAAPILFENALNIGHEIGNKYVIAGALEGLGLLASQQRLWKEARSLLEEFLAIERELKNTTQIANALFRLGSVAFSQGDISAARSQFEESLSLYRELGFKQFIAILLNELGEVARYQGDYELAWTLYNESLNRFQEQGVGFENNYLMVLINMGHVAYRQGHLMRARSFFEESLSLCQKLGEELDSALCLMGIAGIFASKKKIEKAVSLISGAQNIFKKRDTQLGPADQVEYERNLEIARAQLDEAAFQAAWDKGHAMSLEQAVAYALQDSDIA